MRLFLIVLLLAGLAADAQAQRPVTAKTASQFMSLLPPLPNVVCGVGEEEKSEFQNRIAVVQQALDEHIDEAQNEEQGITADMADSIRKKAMAKYGISEEDIKKLNSSEYGVLDPESKNLNPSTEAAQKAKDKEDIANRILMSTQGVSLEEIQNLQKMSPSAQQEWAKAYGNTQMAMGNYDSPEAKAEQKNTKDLYGKIQELRQLTEKTDFRNMKESALFFDFERNIRPKADRMLDEEIKPLEQKLDSMIENASEAEINMVRGKLKSLKTDYCREYGTQYRQSISQMPEGITRMMPDYERMEQVQDELVKLQTGADKSPVQKGGIGLSAVSSYANALEKIYSFDLQGPADTE